MKRKGWMIALLVVALVATASMFVPVRSEVHTISSGFDESAK